MKKILIGLLTLAISLSFIACNSNQNSSTSQSKEEDKLNVSNQEDKKEEGFKKNQQITVISREDGSGTRGAFIELMEIQEKNADGKKIDKTTKEAIIADKTDVMLTQVSGNESAIGYVSVASLNENVKALKVDGAEATTQNIKSGEYKVSRPFYIATKAQQNELTKDFISFILSKEGQEVIAKSCITIDDSAKPYAGNKPKGKIVVAGSSSVTPVMEKLAEAYKAINSNAAIDVQQGDSTSGMQAAIDGIADIGMASRSLKDSEKEKLTPVKIALDGIAVITNKSNPLDNISCENVKKIYTGEVTTWDKIN